LVPQPNHFDPPLIDTATPTRAETLNLFHLTSLRGILE
jgi:hypothetical protein